MFEVINDNEPRNKVYNVGQITLAKDHKDINNAKIDLYNYKEIFKNFLETFREKSSETSKYFLVATEMMEKNYNMFHVSLKDIKQYNPKLAGFMVAQHRALDSEITGLIQKFIEDKNIIFNNGLYFNLDRSKWRHCKELRDYWWMWWILFNFVNIFLTQAMWQYASAWVVGSRGGGE